MTLSFPKTPGTLCCNTAKTYCSESDSSARNKDELITIIIIYLSSGNRILSALQNIKEHMSWQILYHEFSDACILPFCVT